jgi:hypothetical protein
MIANVIGRVKNISLPRSQGLLPLFEAIINSVDAIEDARGDFALGSIDIRILRQEMPLLNTGANKEDRILGPITGFEITDNGIGFTERNYSAFNEADTQAKASRGGKGVGRFVWLCAFTGVEIDSVFQDGASLMRRSFLFSLETNQGISDHELRLEPEETTERTTVRLLGFKPEYEGSVPKSAKAIAQRIVEHCLEYYVLKKMPNVRLVDENAEDAVLLNTIYSELVANTASQELSIGESSFQIIHFMLHAHANLKHFISYCAVRRTVKTERIAYRIPNLPPVLPAPDGSGHVVYAGYVASEYLDRHVNQQRTDFDTISGDGSLFPDELSWPEIEDKVLNASKEFLHPYTENARVEKEERIQEFVASRAPEYRYIVANHSDKLDAIPADASVETMDSKLHEISREIDTRLKKQGQQLLEQGFPSDDEGVSDRLEEFSRWWEDYNAAGKASLAKYIVNRKITLQLLENALDRQSTGKYSCEEVVHKLIFPLKTTSDDVTYDEHNLWIIDEKLAYHQYLASDIPLKQVPALESASLSRPDLLFFFDRAIAVVDEDHPFGSGVVIFEFKRPMRNDYDEKDNPIQQVLGYVQEIRAGKAVSKRGRPFAVSPHTPFYCYIVCDLRSQLAQQAEIHNLKATPDGNGYFGYFETLSTYVEVIGFDKLLSDANKRNRVLFEKLCLPNYLSDDQRDNGGGKNPLARR